MKSPPNPTRPMFILYWEETAAAQKTYYPVSEKCGVLEGGDVACLYPVGFVWVFFFFFNFCAR